MQPLLGGAPSGVSSQLEGILKSAPRAYIINIIILRSPHAGDILLRVFIESLHIKRLLASDYYSTIDVADVDWSGRRVALTWQTRVGPGDAGGPGGRGGDTD
eukprot:9477447-Pyramimonas_sp.AAC.2